MKRYEVYCINGWLEVCQAGHTSKLARLNGWETARLDGVARANCKAEALQLALESKKVVEACERLYYFLDESAWVDPQADYEDLVIED